MTTPVTEGNDTHLPDPPSNEIIIRITLHRPGPRLVITIPAGDQL